MKELNLPKYSFTIRGREGEEMILDTFRNKFVRLTSEEWVRQNFLRYLVHEGGYPAGLIGVEVFFRQNKLKKRIDILVHNRRGEPVLMVECKNHEVKLDESVFEQIVTYNMKYKVPYIVVTNGMRHYACRIDFRKMLWDYLLVIPLYEELAQ